MSKPLITVNQKYTALNAAAKQYVGGEDLTVIDASNLTDFGTENYDNLPEGTKEAFETTMVALVTEQVFISKVYQKLGIKLLSSGSIMGILQKNRMVPDSIAKLDPSYDMAEGDTSDPFKHNSFKIISQYFQNKNAEMFEYSIPKETFTGLFLNPSKFEECVDMIVQNNMNMVNIHLDVLQKLVANQAIGMVLSKAKPTQVIYLLRLYNAWAETPIDTPELAITSKDFGKFAKLTIQNTIDLMKEYTILTNTMDYPGQLDEEGAHMIFNDKFINAIQVYTYTDSFNLEWVKLPNFSKIHSWQGPAAGDSFKDCTTIKVSGVEYPWSTVPETIDESYVVGFIAGKDALGVINENLETTNQWDPVKREMNYFTHVDSQTWVDPYEEFVVFSLAPEEVTTPGETPEELLEEVNE